MQSRIVRRPDPHRVCVIINRPLLGFSVRRLGGCQSVRPRSDVTTSGFSPAARKTAEFLSKRTVLIDGDHLTGLMIRYNVGCRVKYSFEIKAIDEEFFE